MTCLLELPRRALRPLKRVLVRVDDAEHLFLYYLCWKKKGGGVVYIPLGWRVCVMVARQGRAALSISFVI